MLNTIIPTSRYNKTTYPNLEDRADGMPIPLCYGAVTDITPVIVDQAAHQYKICSNALSAIDDIRYDGTSLSRVDAINGVTVGGAGAGEFKVKGDQAATYVAALSIKVINSTGNDDTYTVKAGGSSHAAGVTTIPVDEAVADATVDGDIMQSSESNFTGDLVNGEFSFVTGSPLCTAGDTYYMIWTADFDVDAADYIWVVSRTPSFYAGHMMYFIDGADVWSPQAAYDATFRIYGRKAPGGAEELLVDGSSIAGAVANYGLRSHADRTKIAQSFEIPGAGDYYITRIQYKTRKIGTPAPPGSNVWIEIHSTQDFLNQVGASSAKTDVNTLHTAAYWQGESTWSVINAEDIKADATGEFNQVDDILDDVLQNVLGVDAGDIDAAAFAALGAEKTENLAAYIDSERKFQAFVEKLEAGQLFKFLTRLNDTYTVVYYDSSLYYYRVTDSNKYINWEENGGGEETAIITTGIYSGGDALATEIETKMNAETGDLTVTFLAGKFTIDWGGAGFLELLWDTGTNAENCIATLLGFDDSADDSGAISYTSDEAVGGVLTLSDEDFLSFKSYRDLTAVYKTIKVKYNENPTDQTFDVAEDSSAIAEHIYKNHETLEVETYLVSSVDAAALATAYIALLKEPQRYIEFEVDGYGWDLIPTKKVSITRTRGDNASGTFSSVIFRILSIRKSLSRGTTKMKAVLDTQTY